MIKFYRLGVFICIVFLASSITVLAGNGAADKKMGDEYQIRCIAFYNLENLFDTLHDADKNDYEYLPNGSMQWTGKKYRNKINKMAYAISQLGTDYDPNGAMCVGVAEVENIGCLKDLCAKLKELGRTYEPILLESPDRRGVDVGFLYQPDRFKVTKVNGFTLKAHYADGNPVMSRLQLVVSGYILGSKRPEKVHISVNHWPSRYGGELSSRATRDTAAMLVRYVCDSIYQTDSRAKIVIMGDLNDDPFNNSCANILNAQQSRQEVEAQGLFNTMWEKLNKGTGSLSYNGQWNLFDQIIISEPLLNEDKSSGRWTYWKSQIFNKDFLTVQEGSEKGTPLRTHKGGVWQNGYSDHYPTMIYLIRKK